MVFGIGTTTACSSVRDHRRVPQISRVSAETYILCILCRTEADSLKASIMQQCRSILFAIGTSSGRRNNRLFTSYPTGSFIKIQSPTRTAIIEFSEALPTHQGPFLEKIIHHVLYNVLYGIVYTVYHNELHNELEKVNERAPSNAIQSNDRNSKNRCSRNFDPLAWADIRCEIFFKTEFQVAIKKKVKLSSGFLLKSYFMKSPLFMLATLYIFQILGCAYIVFALARSLVSRTLAHTI